MITTICSLPPIIKQSFNRYLLDPLTMMYMDFVEKIIPLAKKKIRDCDVGKKKDFEILLIQIQVAYERKKAEEKEHEAKKNKYRVTKLMKM